jgi:hypothetical protein
MFYRCLKVMNDNSYDNIIHIYTCEYLTENCLLLFILYTLCVGHLSISFHMKADCRHRDVDYFQKNTYHMLSQSQLTEAKCVKKNEYILRMCHICTISGNSRKSTITVLNKTLEDFLLFFSSYLSLWLNARQNFALQCRMIQRTLFKGTGLRDRFKRLTKKGQLCV